MDLLTDVPLRLNPNDNPEFQQLFDKCNELAAEWVGLNESVLRFPTQTFWISSLPEKLLNLGRKLHEHQKRWSDWENAAREFALNPRLFIEHGPQVPITFLHYVAELREMIRHRADNTRLLIQNYNNVCNDYKEQRNLTLSLLGIVLGLLGIAISVFASC